MFLSNKPTVGRYPPKPPLDLYEGQSISFDRELKKWVLEATGAVLEFRKPGSFTIPTTEYR